MPLLLVVEAPFSRVDPVPEWFVVVVVVVVVV